MAKLDEGRERAPKEGTLHRVVRVDLDGADATRGGGGAQPASGRNASAARASLPVFGAREEAVMSVKGMKGRRGFLKTAGGALGAIAAMNGRTAGAKNEVITAVTFIRGLEGKEEELEAHLLSLSAPTRAEPGCVMYDLYRSPVVKNHFLRLEVWASPAALEAHKATPHIRASFEKRQREGWSTEITVWKRVG
jgi:quinol monooxygenase YgiN